MDFLFDLLPLPANHALSYAGLVQSQSADSGDSHGFSPIGTICSPS